MEYISDFVSYTSDGVTDFAKAIAAAYPFVKIFNIGKSVYRKPIKCFKIGKGKPVVMYFAGIHANEYITSTVLMRYISELCLAIGEQRKICGVNPSVLLKDRCAVFVPLLNPDGCDTVICDGKNLNSEDKERILNLCDGNCKKLKANLRGVDINHNFNADWKAVKEAELKAGICAPSAKMFGGYFPESEPETVAAVCAMQILNPKSVIALHTQGEEIYCGYKNRANSTELKMAEVFSCLCGYRIATPFGLSFAGGLKDWYSQKFKKPSFTFECGKGENPLPMTEAKLIYDRLRETFSVSLLM